MSTLNVDKVDPNTGTTLELGTSGDTISIPSGATLDISASTLTPPATMPASSGVNLTSLNATNLGSGTVPDARFPATLPAASGVNLTSLDAANLGSNIVPTARLGTGTASSSTILYGDQTYKTEPSGFDVTSITGQTALDATPADTDEFVLSDAGTLKKMDYDYIKGVHKNAWQVSGSGALDITINVQTVVPLDVETFDPDGLYDTGTNKWVCPADGTYYFYGQCIVSSPDVYTGIREVGLRGFKNDVNYNDNVRNWAFCINELGIYYHTVEQVWSATLSADDYIVYKLYLYGTNPISGAFVSYGSAFGGWRLY